MANLGEYIGAGSGITKGLWHLNGNSNDSSGNSNDGTDTDITYSLANGRFGQGAGLNGSSSYIDCGLPVLTAIDNWTISCWVKPDSSSTGITTIIVCNGDTDDNGYHLRYRDGNFYILLGFVTISDAVEATVGEFQHIVVIRRSGSLYLYKNGSENSLGTDTPITPSGKTLIGAYLSGGSLGGNFFDGSIDEVIIENRAWTAQEIKKYYTNSLGIFATL